MSSKTLANDLDNCLINFDRKVVVTNLLDEYGGVLEQIAKTVNEFLSAEAAKGKHFEKTFLLRGVQPDSENEVITLVSEEKLKQQEIQLKRAQSMLYSAETVGGSKSPPTEFEPLKHISVRVNGLQVAQKPKTNGLPTAVVKAEKEPVKKVGALGAMFKKQETAATSAAKTSPDKSNSKKPEPEKKIGALGALFKKQETAALAKKNSKTETNKNSNPIGVMFKKQESTTSQKSPQTTKSTPSKANKPGPASKKNISNSVTKIEEELKPPTPKKMNEFFKADTKEPKKESAANVSVNLFEESAASSEDEETLDRLKREVLTDDDENKPSVSNKRRRILDSDDEDTGPEVKVERKEAELEVMEIEDDIPSQSSTFMDEEGFIVTVKGKNKKAPIASKRAPTPVKVKKESPKSVVKKEAASKTPAAKTKQGNITNFFTRK